MKQRIQERIKNQMERTYNLTFDQQQSVYKEEEKLESPSAQGGRGGMRMIMMGGGATGPYYKNLQDNIYRSENDLMGKIFLVEDSLIKWDWTLTNETKQIGEYTCYKATAVRKLTEAEISMRDQMRERMEQRQHKDEKYRRRQKREERTGNGCRRRR